MAHTARDSHVASPRPGANRRRGAAGAGLVTALIAAVTVLAGCSSALKIEPFAQSDSEACQRVAEFWPLHIQGMERRVVAVQSDGVAAWGDPEIIARCGGTPPGPSSETCVDVDGVHWLEIPLADGTSFTTYGRDPAIEVLIPDDYSPAMWLLPEFAAAAQTVEQTRFCTSAADIPDDSTQDSVQDSTHDTAAPDQQ